MAQSYYASAERRVETPSRTPLALQTYFVRVKPCIYHVSISSPATIADNQIVWYIQRFSGVPAIGDNARLALVDPNGPALSAVSQTSHATYSFTPTTQEPTYTADAILWRLGLNQRGMHSIVFDPEGGLTVSSVHQAGVGIYPVHASAQPTMGVVLYFRE